MFEWFISPLIGIALFISVQILRLFISSYKKVAREKEEARSDYEKKCTRLNNERTQRERANANLARSIAKGERERRQVVYQKSAEERKARGEKKTPMDRWRKRIEERQETRELSASEEFNIKGGNGSLGNGGNGSLGGK